MREEKKKEEEVLEVELIFYKKFLLVLNKQ